MTDNPQAGEAIERSQQERDRDALFRIYKAHSEILQQVADLLGTEDDEAIVGQVRALADGMASGRLLAALGQTLTAYIAGFPGRATVRLVATGEASTTALESVRLRLADQLFESVAKAEQPDVARAWMIGSNPWLSHGSPAQAIREDRHDEVRAAAHAFVTNQGGA